MERLTYWNDELGCWSYHGPSGEAAKRLAAYEDIGLEPEEIDSKFIHSVIEENRCLNELAQAEKDGRLVVLPCKVGDTVWANIAIVGDRYKASDRPYQVEVVFIGIGGNGGFFHAQYTNGRIFPFDFDKIGKTVFLTREEAKAALKKKEET